MKKEMNSFEQDFIQRLSELRYNKKVSAREMSLAIGQNAGYIHNIESGKALPSMSSFFYICEYLDVTPKEFFTLEFDNPKMITELLDYIGEINPELYPHIYQILKSLAGK